jgi:hypothetical protein
MRKTQRAVLPNAPFLAAQSIPLRLPRPAVVAFAPPLRPPAATLPLSVCPRNGASQGLSDPSFPIPHSSSKHHRRRGRRSQKKQLSLQRRVIGTAYATDVCMM